jgi:putative peptide zinc metalloprotease protein
MVAAAGMAVEVFVAALAFYAWLAVEPGLVRALLFNVMLVAGVSTLVFNGNPLLRYDAYYMLADLIEMPNLASRSTRWWGWLVDRRLFGVKDATAPEADPVEQGWLTFYGAASFVYRTLVTVSIAIFIAGQFFFVGVVLALWAVASMALWPLVKGLRHVVRSPALRARRPRVWSVLGGGAAVLVLLLFVVPAPLRHVVEGVVWLPEQAQLRSAQEGFLERLLIEPGARVRAGELVFEVRNPRLDAQIAQLKARVAELQAAYNAQLGSDRASAATAFEQLQAERKAMAVAQERADGLFVRAAVDGVLVVPRAADLPGRWLRIGDLVGYLVPDAAASRPPLVRVVVPQDAVDAVRHDTQAISLKAALSTSAVQQGHVAREIPAGDEYLPSRVLAVEGGGQIATDPRDTHGARSLERGFQFDIEVQPAAGDPPGAAAPAYFGERVHVRFEHSPQPLGVQAVTALRRLLLSHFQA